MVVDAPSFEFGFFGGVSGRIVVIVVAVIVITLSWEGGGAGEGGGAAAAIDWAAVCG